MAGSKRQFIINTFGNVVEFYEFTLFAFLSGVVAPLYFPAENELASVLSLLGVFGVSFFMRPVGAIFFGYVGDAFGRKVALQAAVLAMTLTSFAFALLPTYEQIGIWAPVLLVMVRLIQGFSVGGEYAGAVVSSLESTSSEKTYLIGSYVTCSSIVGTLLASFVTVQLIQPGMSLSAWRYGYFLGGVLGLLSFVLVTLNVQHKTETKRPRFREVLVHLWNKSRRTFLTTFVIASFSGAYFYTAFSLASVVMISVRHWDPVLAHFASISGMVTYLICVPLVARMANRYGGVRVMLWGVAMTLTIGTAALLMILHGARYEIVVAGSMLLSLCCAVSQAPINGLMCMAFPERRRYTGFGAAYGIGISLFGGLTGMILVKLILLHPTGIWGLVYLQSITLIAGLALCLWRRRDRHVAQGDQRLTTRTVLSA